MGIYDREYYRGESAGSGWFWNLAPVCKAIILINVVVFVVMASIGHIKDLPAKGLGVDVQNNFQPEYEVIPDSRKRNNKYFGRCATAPSAATGAC